MEEGGNLIVQIHELVENFVILKEVKNLNQSEVLLRGVDYGLKYKEVESVYGERNSPFYLHGR